MPRRAHLRMMPVAAGAWACALATTLAPHAAAPLAMTLWALCAAAMVGMALRTRRTRRRPRAALILVVVLAAAAAAASHVAFAQPARSEAERFALAGGRAVWVHATVTGKVEARATGEWVFDAVATRLDAGRVGDAVRVEITVRLRPGQVERPEGLDAGAVVAVQGTARPARPGERAVLTVIATRGIDVIAPPRGLLAVAADLRKGLVGAVTGLPPPGAGLIPGLAVGDTSAVPAELDAAMKASALSHLTAVSGANCAIVVGLAFAAVAAAGGARRTRVAAGVVTLAGFVLLVTPEPSVVRAATMAGVAMLGVLLGRTGAGTAVLCLSVTVLLIADPWLAGSLGFALSTAATASLLLFARPLAGGLSRWMPRPLALALSVPLAAQLACGPLLVVITPSIPVFGVIANLLTAPAAPVGTVVGLAACLSGALPWLQHALTAVAWLPASWIAGTAVTFSDLPGSQLPWPEGGAGVVALAAVGAAIGCVVALPRTRRWLGLRIGSALVVAVAMGVAAGGVALATTAGRWTLPGQWGVIACDVGQGDAVLLRSAGAVALVDTGPDAAALHACLGRVGVDRVDLLVLTHFDLDHIGGLDAVIGRVGTVLHGPVASPDAAAALSRLERSGARSIAAHAQLGGRLGDARWRVLWPPARSHAFPAGNDASLVLDVRGGQLPAALLLGDLSASPQRALAASGALEPPYDLVKVAHHGSADQDTGLYDTAASAVALVTVGENTYGHPRAEILGALRQQGARIARTDREGLIALWRAGAQLRVWRERGGDVADAG